jgi:hypothetical protein
MKTEIHLSQNMSRTCGHTGPAGFALAGVQVDVTSFGMVWKWEMKFHLGSFVAGKDYIQRGVLAW